MTTSGGVECGIGGLYQALQEALNGSNRQWTAATSPEGLVAALEGLSEIDHARAVEWFRSWPPPLLAMVQGGADAVLGRGMAITFDWAVSETYEVDLRAPEGQDMVVLHVRTPNCPT
jgi:hypothetical protein